MLDRFVRALIAAGAQQIIVRHPSCRGCGRDQPAVLRLADGVLCSACYAKRTASTRCAGCDRPRRPYTRDTAGNPLCESCVHQRATAAERTELLARITEVLTPQTGLDRATVIAALTTVAPLQRQLRALHDLLTEHRLDADGLPYVVSRLIITLRDVGADLPAPRCATCRQPTGAGVSLRGMRVRCQQCAWRCPTCDAPRRGDDSRPCRRCQPDPRQHRGDCSGCHEQLPLSELNLCRTCHARATRRCSTCHHNRALTRYAGEKICQPCALSRTLELLIPERSGGALSALRAAILSAGPVATRHWLERPLIAGLLADLHTGRIALTHDALDAQPPTRAIEHLRDLLIASGALPADPHRLIHQFQASSEKLLLTHPLADHRIVNRWLSWQVLPRLRRHTEQPVDIRAALWNAKRTLKQVIGFLATLDTAGHTLANCQQSDLDTWFATRSATPHLVRPFLAWTQRAGHLPRSLTLPPSYRPSPLGGPLEAEQRWSIARQLVKDNTLDPADRVAGALVVLYAQPLVRICALTTDDIGIDGPTVTLAIRNGLLELHEPFATLIQTLPVHRRDGTAEQLRGRWLFPGTRAGRHLEPINLGKWLRTIGIEPRRMRMAALEQLTQAIPPAMLAGLLGINVAHTVKRTSQTGGDWAKYAASSTRVMTRP